MKELQKLVPLISRLLVQSQWKSNVLGRSRIVFSELFSLMSFLAGLTHHVSLCPQDHYNPASLPACFPVGLLNSLPLCLLLLDNPCQPPSRSHSCLHDSAPPFFIVVWISAPHDPQPPLTISILLKIPE